MTQISALILASFIAVEPPFIATPMSAERTVEAPHVEPTIDASAVNRFVIEAAERYSGEH